MPLRTPTEACPRAWAGRRCASAHEAEGTHIRRHRVAGALMAGLTGTMVNGYVVREALGQGGFCVVYRATRHDDPSVQVALKILQEQCAGDAVQVKRLIREHQLLGRLSHPGVPRVHKAVEIRGRAGFFLEYIPGMTLAQGLGGALRPPQPRAAIELLRVAAYLHRQQVVHNDFKLENAIADPHGRMVVIDYGSAVGPASAGGFLRRLFGRKKTVTGTVAYLAPELITGGEASPRSDIYALGVCCHLLLTGRLPFAFRTRTEQLEAHLHEAPPSVLGSIPHLPAEIEQVLTRAMAKDPLDRPATAEAFLHQLDGLEQVVVPGAPWPGGPGGAVTPAGDPPASRQSRA